LQAGRAHPCAQLNPIAISYSTSSSPFFFPPFFFPPFFFGTAVKKNCEIGYLIPNPHLSVDAILFT
jgi:hypothetical protein